MGDDKFEEKIVLLTGQGMWHIGKVWVSDGPHGMRSQIDGAHNNDSIEATCFPTASAVASSWNRELLRQMAAGIAKEAKELGVAVVLGPGINIKRSPLCGRNFEYYSEDPFLAGAYATEFISSMQKNGVGTSLKHFAGNSQETHRMTANSMIDERALHEIYLAGFEMAVKNAKPATIMASYNYLNGLPACENKYLLTDVLRKKWGYDGLVMSDWGACVDLPACIKAGLDVEMPDSNGNHTADVREALKTGKINKKDINNAYIRIKNLEKKYENPNINTAISEEIREANHQLAKKIEEDSAVLLKNDKFFPIKDIKEILIIGDLALKPRIQGGGSSHINTNRVKNGIEAFEENGFKVRFAKGYECKNFKVNNKLENEAILQLIKATEDNIPILFFGGLTDIAEGEGFDRENYDLPDNQKSILKALLEINSNIGFISFCGSPYNLDLPAKCRAILQMYLGGEAVSEALVNLVTGKVNPSGKLAETIPYSENDTACYGLFGKQLGQKEHLDDVYYRESIFVGYRYYDSFNVPVRFCFGHGLSYTKFEYTNMEVTGDVDKGITVSFDIKNIGEFDGSEIAEIYVKNPDDNSFRAKRELREFVKITLCSGEVKRVSVNLTERAFSAYQNGEFHVIEGNYEIQVGASIQDIRLIQPIEIKGVALNFPIQIPLGMPLSEAAFDRIYNYKKTNFSHLQPGDFTTKNSLRQMAPYSYKARFLIRIGKIATKIMLFPKSLKDPEARMMLEGICEGNIDTVCNQSGGIIKKKTILKLVDSANKKRRGRHGKIR